MQQQQLTATTTTATTATAKMTTNSRGSTHPVGLSPPGHVARSNSNQRSYHTSSSTSPSSAAAMKQKVSHRVSKQHQQQQALDAMTVAAAAPTTTTTTSCSPDRSTTSSSGTSTTCSPSNSSGTPNRIHNKNHDWNNDHVLVRARTAPNVCSTTTATIRSSPEQLPVRRRASFHAINEGMTQTLKRMEQYYQSNLFDGPQQQQQQQQQQQITTQQPENLKRSSQSLVVSGSTSHPILGDRIRDLKPTSVNLDPECTIQQQQACFPEEYNYNYDYERDVDDEQDSNDDAAVVKKSDAYLGHAEDGSRITHPNKTNGFGSEPIGLVASSSSSSGDDHREDRHVRQYSRRRRRHPESSSSSSRADPPAAKPGTTNQYNVDKTNTPSTSKGTFQKKRQIKKPLIETLDIHQDPSDVDFDDTFEPDPQYKADEGSIAAPDPSVRPPLAKSSSVLNNIDLFLAAKSHTSARQGTLVPQKPASSRGSALSTPRRRVCELLSGNDVVQPQQMNLDSAVSRVTTSSTSTSSATSAIATATTDMLEFASPQATLEYELHMTRLYVQSLLQHPEIHPLDMASEQIRRDQDNDIQAGLNATTLAIHHRSDHPEQPPSYWGVRTNWAPKANITGGSHSSRRSRDQHDLSAALAALTSTLGPRTETTRRMLPALVAHDGGLGKSSSSSSSPSALWQDVKLSPTELSMEERSLAGQHGGDFVELTNSRYEATIVPNPTLAASLLDSDPPLKGTMSFVDTTGICDDSQRNINIPVDDGLDTHSHTSRRNESETEDDRSLYELVDAEEQQVPGSISPATTISWTMEELEGAPARVESPEAKTTALPTQVVEAQMRMVQQHHAIQDVPRIKMIPRKQQSQQPKSQGASSGNVPNMAIYTARSGSSTVKTATTTAMTLPAPTVTPSPIRRKTVEDLIWMLSPDGNKSSIPYHRTAGKQFEGNTNETHGAVRLQPSLSHQNRTKEVLEANRHNRKKQIKPHQAQGHSEKRKDQQDGKTHGNKEDEEHSTMLRHYAAFQAAAVAKVGAAATASLRITNDPTMTVEEAGASRAATTPNAASDPLVPPSPLADARRDEQPIQRADSKISHASLGASTKPNQRHFSNENQYHDIMDEEVNAENHQHLLPVNVHFGNAVHAESALGIMDHILAAASMSSLGFLEDRFGLSLNPFQNGKVADGNSSSRSTMSPGSFPDDNEQETEQDIFDTDDRDRVLELSKERSTRSMPLKRAPNEDLGNRLNNPTSGTSHKAAAAASASTSTSYTESTMSGKTSVSGPSCSESALVSSSASSSSASSATSFSASASTRSEATQSRQSSVSQRATTGAKARELTPREQVIVMQLEKKKDNLESSEQSIDIGSLGGTDRYVPSAGVGCGSRIFSLPTAPKPTQKPQLNAESFFRSVLGTHCWQDILLGSSATCGMTGEAPTLFVRSSSSSSRTMNRSKSTNASSGDDSEAKKPEPRHRERSNQESRLPQPDPTPSRRGTLGKTHRDNASDEGQNESISSEVSTKALPRENPNGAEPVSKSRERTNASSPATVATSVGSSPSRIVQLQQHLCQQAKDSPVTTPKHIVFALKETSLPAIDPHGAVPANTSLATSNTTASSLTMDHLSFGSNPDTNAENGPSDKLIADQTGNRTVTINAATNAPKAPSVEATATTAAVTMSLSGSGSTPSSGGNKSVRFAAPLVTGVQHRPYTDPEDLDKLYFAEEELHDLEMDRENVEGDQFECMLLSPPGGALDDNASVGSVRTTSPGPSIKDGKVQQNQQLPQQAPPSPASPRNKFLGAVVDGVKRIKTKNRGVAIASARGAITIPVETNFKELDDPSGRSDYVPELVSLNEEPSTRATPSTSSSSSLEKRKKKKSIAVSVSYKNKHWHRPRHYRTREIANDEGSDNMPHANYPSIHLSPSDLSALAE